MKNNLDFPSNIQQLKIIKFLETTRSSSVPEISLNTGLLPNRVQENLQSLERQGFVKKPWLTKHAYRLTNKGMNVSHRTRTIV